MSPYHGQAVQLSGLLFIASLVRRCRLQACISFACVHHGKGGIGMSWLLGEQLHHDSSHSAA